MLREDSLQSLPAKDLGEFGTTLAALLCLTKSYSSSRHLAGRVGETKAALGPQ